MQCNYFQWIILHFSLLNNWTSFVHRFSILSIATLQWSMSSLFCYKWWVFLSLPLPFYLCFDQNHIAITASWTLMLKIMSWSCYLFEHHMSHYIYDEVVHHHPFTLASPLEAAHDTRWRKGDERDGPMAWKKFNVIMSIAPCFSCDTVQMNTTRPHVLTAE
jgi:hypothetical protein